VDDPPDGDRHDTVVTTEEYERRLAKFTSYILDVLDAPDILAVQEAEKLGVLEDLAADIAIADPSVAYTAYLIEGNDIGTIDIGFLVRSSVEVDGITQLGKDETFVDPGDGSVDILNDRPPLLLEGRCDGDFPISVIAVHNRSLNGIDGDDGERVRAKRLAQAQFLAGEIQDIQTSNPLVNLVVTGDFNGFEFTDGYVDVVGQTQGTADPNENLESGPDLVDPDLINQVLSLDPSERYSFIFRGNAQTLDHALTSMALDTAVRGLQFGRGNADAAEILLGSDSPGDLPLRSSDHDGLVLFISKQQEDSDGDGVPDNIDACPATVVPEALPTTGLLGRGRYALKSLPTFDKKEGRVPVPDFTIEDTRGCSCDQILDVVGHTRSEDRRGCTRGTMDSWVAGGPG